MQFIRVSIPKRFRYLWLWMEKEIVMTTSHIDQIGTNKYMARGKTQGLFGQEMLFTIVNLEGYWTIMH